MNEITRLDCKSIDTEYIYETECPSCNKYILIGSMFEEDKIKYCPYCGYLINLELVDIKYNNNNVEFVDMEIPFKYNNNNFEFLDIETLSLYFH